MFTGNVLRRAAIVWFAFPVTTLVFAGTPPTATPAASATPTPVILPVIQIVGQVEGAGTPATTLTQQAILDRDIRQFDQLGAYAPNLITESAGSRSFNDIFGMRGMVNSLYYSDPAVAIIVDDVPFPNMASASLELANLNQIQVLRGPQGTLYGTNSPAGAIVVSPLLPDDTTRLNARAGYGTYQDQTYQAYASGPLRSGVLQMGGSVLYSSHQGYQTNTFLQDRPDRQEAYAGKVDLRFLPASDWEIRFSANFQDFDDGAERLAPLGSTDPFTVRHDFNGQTLTDTDVEALHIVHATDDFVMTSITSRVNYQLHPLSLDLDFTTKPIDNIFITYDQDTWAEELRFTSPPTVTAGDPTWRCGTFVSYNDLKSSSQLQFPAKGASDTDHPYFHTLQSVVYGQVTFPVAKDLNLTPGFRAEDDDHAAGRTDISPAGTSTSDVASSNYLNIGPKLLLEWQADDHVAPYASTGLSYRSGGYSSFQEASTLLPYAAENTWTNETGVKTSWLDGAVTANISAFWNETRNYQLEIYEIGDFGVINIPRVTSKGFEVETTQKLSSTFSFDESLGYTDARFDRYSDPSTGADYANNRVPFIPEYNALVAAQFRHPSGYMARLEFVATGNTWYDTANTPFYKQDAYGQINATIGYEQKHWGVYLYGKNLTDTRYNTLEIAPNSVGSPGPPATVGFQVTAQY